MGSNGIFFGKEYSVIYDQMDISYISLYIYIYLCIYPFYMHSNVILVGGFLPKGLTSEQPNRRSELCPSLAAPNFDKAASGISSERDAGKSMGNPWESPIDIWEKPRKKLEKKT
jgi:hypothetical protein